MPEDDEVASSPISSSSPLMARSSSRFSRADVRRAEALETLTSPLSQRGGAATLLSGGGSGEVGKGGRTAAC